MLYFIGILLTIQNLDDAIDVETLREAFSRFGTVLNVKIVSEIKRKRYGMVSFLSPADAAKAILNMNESSLLSNTLYVTHATYSPSLKRRLPGTQSIKNFGMLSKVRYFCI